MKKLATLIIFVFALTSVVMAQDNFSFNFQGRLLNSDGTPISDGEHLVRLSIYSDSTGGNLLWREQRYAQTHDGIFDIEAGDITACSLGVFDGSARFMEVQVGSEILSRRIRFNSTPHTALSQRVAGDIMTFPGTIRWFDPQPVPPGVDPLMEASALDGQAIFKMFDPQPVPPGYSSTSTIEMNTLSGTGTIKMFDPQPVPPGSINTSLIEMNTATGTGAIKMFDPQPVPPGYSSASTIEMNTLSGTGTIKMFDPQPVPPGSSNAPLIEMNATAGTGTIKMFDPQPVPPGQVCIEFTSNGTASFFSHGSEYMGVEPSPFHSGGDLVMSDSDGVNTMAFSSLGTASFFSHGTEYMGVEPSPFNTGGALKMYGSFPLQPLVILSSDGKLSLGTSSTTNILTIQQSSNTDPIADAWTVYSSRRWKTNIHPIQNALDKVMSLNGVTYDWIENGKHDIGLIAEDVGQVIPEIVAYEDNGIDAKSVDYARLTALLIEAVKEQQKTIEELKIDIKELQQKEVSQ